jgi:hypothetical protein
MLSLLLALQAHTRPENREDVPNGMVESCSTCHVNDSGGGQRNAFGADYQATSTWSALAPLDSDSDGHTNGVELGDPDGTWVPGADPGPFLSHPGDPDSVPPAVEPTGDTGAPPPPVDPSGPPPADDGAGCGCAQARPSYVGWLVALLALARRPTHHPNASA